MRSLKGFAMAICEENHRGYAAVIPDIKCISPKEGDLLRGRDPVETAQYLKACGAPVLSVVTEGEHFGGSTKLLRDIVRATNLPVLRKDFILNKDTIAETVELGGAAILLICAIAEAKIITQLFEHALKLGIEPFVEVCNNEEMELAKKLGAGLIGINNRNIATLEIDNGSPARTALLAPKAPTDALIISESGILSPRDAELAVSAGANGILVGTTLWQAGDMGVMYRSLRIERRCKP